MLLHLWLDGIPVCPIYTQLQSYRMLHTHVVFSSTSSLTGQRKLEYFLGGKPTSRMMSSAGIPLIRMYASGHMAGRQIKWAFQWAEVSLLAE